MIDTVSSNTASLQAPYPALASASEAMFEEKRSTFTALLVPVTDRDQAMAALAQIRSERPGASHYCWAYVLGSAKQPRSQAFNDDGEPSGTAGKPILHVLTQRDAGDCLAVVVRTFGGVKLGAGGLVRAYGASVSQALDQAEWQEVTPTHPVTIVIDFAHEERVRRSLEQHLIGSVSADYRDRVYLQVQVPEATHDTLRDEIQALTSGHFQWQES